MSRQTDATDIQDKRRLEQETSLSGSREAARDLGFSPGPANFCSDAGSQFSHPKGKSILHIGPM